MTNTEYEKLKQYITIYQNTNDKNTLEQIINMNLIYIKSYLDKCKYEELEKYEILSIIILSIIDFIKYIDLSIDIKKYEKKLKDTIKKEVYEEVKKHRIYNAKESYEYYASQHKNGQDNSYIEPNKESFDNIEVEKYIYNLTIEEQQFVMMKYGFDDDKQKNNSELSKLFNRSVNDIKTEEVKILRKLKNNINKNLKD